MQIEVRDVIFQMKTNPFKDLHEAGVDICVTMEHVRVS